MTLFSIAPHAKFLETLAERVLDGALLNGWDRTGPFWLSDITIVVPTRRAKLALAEHFARHGNGLLPDIRTFGGEVEDEEPFLPPFDLPVLPGTVSTLERRLVLSWLVSAWAKTAKGQQAFANPPNAAEILGMAESLGGLLDDLTTQDVGPSQLNGIVPDDLAENWQQTLEFLKIVLGYWPERLKTNNTADAAHLRNIRLDRQAAATALVYGDRPVIAAGSTGSIPATARLLAAVAKLPRGAIVLPGFDTGMTAQGHADLLNNAKNPHGHPQYGMAKLLRALGAGVGDVVELAGDAAERTTLMRRALALTDDTALWAQQKLTPPELARAVDGVSLISARTEDEEARAVALAARDALAQRRTVGIITPDRNLARRIAAELGRFGVTVDDAAGVPLFHSAVGRLARQILALAANGCGAVDLMALLRNRAALFGLERERINALADQIELGLLRGQRASPGLAGLRRLLDVNISGDTKYPVKRLYETDRPQIEDLFTRIEAALSPLLVLLETSETDSGRFGAALMAAFDAVADGAQLPGRRELNDWSIELRTQKGEGLKFPPRGLDNVLAALMLGFQVRTSEIRRQDIFIWGQIEARLQNPDLLILAALNEDKWPEPADPGPWLSRGMRLAAGLEPPERQSGLAAHDFAQALGNGAVIVAYSERLGTRPAIASRLVQRLEAFAGDEAAKAMRAKGQVWLEAARQLDAVAEVRQATPPAPNPSAELRPRKLSVTEIETLMRSPYDVYAKHVLKLRPMDPLGENPDARERGNIIHDIFARFVIERCDVMASEALDTLNAMAVEGFAGLDAIGERRDIWLRRFDTAARFFLEFERERNERVRLRHAEIDGEWKLPSGFTLTGRADRVDEMIDGTLEIIDFKTGSPPTPGIMKAFEAPQLLLEAAMGGAGAMAGIAGADTSALTYVKVGLGPEAFVPKDFTLADEFGLMDAADEASRRMQRHVDVFLFHDTPMLARILPLPNQRFAGAYEHLARMAEWTAIDGEEDEL
ncbi:MAG: addB [Devosia sp.]|uniref:double-strand break repair protein AddB n=1 Tax=Devosia sp. TaxID=1871048 RepID=UPI00261077C4|nr:double-strand break repair protein AddB [Devosia sp.]MDB5587816.1 addB [Devosia sp.]